MTIINNPHYAEALRLSSNVGSNFRTLRENKRKLAVSLVAASVVEGFALAEAITDAKKKLAWNKLDSAEQGQMNVFFTAIRAIDGAWKTLDSDTQAAFLAGEKLFSTLAKEIKDKEKQALADDADKPEVIASSKPEAASEAASEAAPEPVADVDDSFEMVLARLALTIEHAPLGSMTDAEESAIERLAEVIQNRRAALAASLEEKAA